MTHLVIFWGFVTIIYFYYNSKTDYFETSLGDFDIFYFITMNIEGLLLNNVAPFQPYRKILKDHIG